MPCSRGPVCGHFAFWLAIGTTAEFVRNVRGTVEEKVFPSLDKEGWTRPQENIAKPPCWERTGWLVQTTDNRWLEPTTPSARADVASRNLLDRAATPP